MSKNDTRILLTAIGTGVTMVIGLLLAWYLNERRKQHEEQDNIMDEIAERVFDA